MDKKKAKALEISIRKEANWLRNQLKKEIQAGAPGGKKFKSITYLSRGWKIQTSNRLRANKRFSRLAGVIRYHVERFPYPEAHIGFIKTSPNATVFRDYVKKHAIGFSKPVTKKMREYLANQGSRRGRLTGKAWGKSKQRKIDSTPFFLKKSTTMFRTPPQQIVYPFWMKYRTRSIRKVRDNFVRKMRGERI